MGRTFEQRFLDAIIHLGGTTEQAVDTKVLAPHLNWADARFDSTREKLSQKGLIRGVKGSATKIRLSDTVKGPDTRKKIFISYSHADEAIKNNLISHLKPLERLGLVNIWHDRKIKAGESISNSVSKEIEEANIIILLVSIDFINSDYCYDIELKMAIDRHKNNEVIIIPIIAKDCFWHKTPFGDLLALPADGKPISNFTNVDEALSQVAKAIFEQVK